MYTEHFATLTLSVLLLAAAPPATEVDDDRVECPNAPYSSIQDAIDSGATNIRVCAGEYYENVNISRTPVLSISGAGAGSTIIHGLAGTPGPIISVTSRGRATIENLTVEGNAILAGRRVYGIRYQESNGTIRGVAVRDIRDQTGHAEGIGIAIESSTVAANVVVEHSEVSNATRVGILANGSAVQARISNNRVQGPSLPKRWAPNGISISRGASALVESNEVWDAASPAPERGAASGIMSRCAGLTKIRYNRIYAADLGVSIVDAQNTWVLDNDIYDSKSDAITLQSVGNYFGDPGCPGGVKHTAQNHVSGNHAANSGGHAISIASFDPNFAVERNSLIANSADVSGSADMVDPTIGNAFAGTRNWWYANVCLTSTPREICGY